MTQPSHLRAITAAAMLLGLTACGGGGGGDATPSAPAVTTTTFSGTAATGAAMANATVSITCAAGFGSTTTSATGTYSKDIASVTLPCALRAASADGTTVLYSVTSVTATGANTQVANITPLTHLVVASLTGTEPATFFDNFNASTAAVATPANVAAAQTAVLNTLTQAGISTAGVTDLIGGVLTAGSRTGYDGVLDAVQAQLAASGTSLATLTTTVAATSPAATAPGTTVVDHTPRLPASLLLKTAASNCAALRSGEYVSINPRRGATLADQIGFISFDAKTLKATDNSHVDGGGTLVADGACAYKIDGDSYVVSQAGVLVGTATEAGKTGLSFLIPRQTMTVAELAGSWNGIGVDAGGNQPLESFSFDVSGNGSVSNLVVCDGALPNTSACAAENATLNISSDSAGNLSITETTPGSSWTDRIFAYRSGSGDLMVLELSPSGSLSAWTKKRPLTLPAVGQVNPASRSIRVNSDLIVTVNDDGLAGSIFAVDTVANTITRTQNLAGGVSYLDTVIINQPREGYQLRLPATAQASDGSTVSVRARTSLSVPGTGLLFQLYPQTNAFQVIVER